MRSIFQAGLKEGKEHIVVGNALTPQEGEKERLMGIGRGEDSKGQMDISQLELEEEYVEIARARLGAVKVHPTLGFYDREKEV